MGSKNGLLRVLTIRASLYGLPALLTRSSSAVVIATALLAVAGAVVAGGAPGGAVGGLFSLPQPAASTVRATHAIPPVRRPIILVSPMARRGGHPDAVPAQRDESRRHSE